MELNAVTLLVPIVYDLVPRIPDLRLLQSLPSRSTCALIKRLVDVAPIVQDVLGHGVHESVQDVDVEGHRLGVAKVPRVLCVQRAATLDHRAMPIL